MMIAGSSRRMLCRRWLSTESAQRPRIVDPTRWTKKTGSNKIFSSVDDAVADIPEGATLCVGGFGLCGSARIPTNTRAECWWCLE